MKKLSDFTWTKDTNLSCDSSSQVFNHIVTGLESQNRDIFCGGNFLFDWCLNNIYLSIFLGDFAKLLLDGSLMAFSRGSLKFGIRRVLGQPHNEEHVADGCFEIAYLTVTEVRVNVVGYFASLFNCLGVHWRLLAEWIHDDHEVLLLKFDIGPPR
jgi:hypothetical protein